MVRVGAGRSLPLHVDAYGRSEFTESFKLMAVPGTVTGIFSDMDLGTR